MLFQTQYFIIFFAVVFVLYWTSRTLRAKHVILLLASLSYYAFCNAYLVPLIIFVALINFRLGAVIWKTKDRHWLYLSLIVNVGCLAIFKYLNFGIESILSVAALVGWNLPKYTFSIALPLGISFYIFQVISYSVDMFNNRYMPYKSLTEYIIYVTFFPKLLAGPIVRANDFKKQLDRQLHLNWSFINQGLNLFIFGVFKKVVIADQAAVFADAVFSAPEMYDSFLAIIGSLAFTFQIYFDFSAYTDMARGVGYLLGYRLPENFLHPYGALGVREFWHKWHITLSTWLRDYIYIPLGGSREGSWKTRYNIMLTMFVGGLWHGAGWNFVIWGGIHGLSLSIEDIIFKKNSLRVKSTAMNFLTGLITFSIVNFAWIFFRASSLDQAFGVMKSILIIPDAPILHQAGLFKIQNWMLGIIVPAIIILISTIEPVDKTLNKYPLPMATLIVVFMIVIVFVVVGKSSDFLYTQF